MPEASGGSILGDIVECFLGRSGDRRQYKHEKPAMRPLLRINDRKMPVRVRHVRGDRVTHHGRTWEMAKQTDDAYRLLPKAVHTRFLVDEAGNVTFA